VAAAWDTSLASRIHPETAAIDHVLDQAAAGDPVRVAAPAVLEVVYGYQRKVGDDPRFRVLLAWFTRFIASDAIRVIALDARAAIVAGQLRGLSSHPPAKRGSDRRSKTMRQAAWLLDIEIAATAFAAGLDVATENRADFELLGELLADAYPSAPRLAVIGSPI
jgi:predicted nucleic acid-binding protein